MNSTAPLPSQPSDTRKKVQIRLVTRSDDIKLPEDPGILLVSTDLRRRPLSDLVNSLLQQEKPIPFEFLIQGQFLKTTIDAFLTANGLSTENTITLEYVRALIPPLYATTFQHDDWVSAVDVLSQSASTSHHAKESLGNERILSGSYDGLLRVWTTSSELLATSETQSNGGRISPIKAARFLTPNVVVSGGLDTVLRLWDFKDSTSPSMESSFTPTLELYGHKWGIESIAVHSLSSRILTAASDHMVGVWSSKRSDAPPAPEALIPNPSSNKRAKSNRSSFTSGVHRRGPLSLLSGHTSVVSSVSFDGKDPTIAYSASHDHTLRTWDLATGTLVDTRTTSHPLLSLLVLNDVNLIATGTSARHITMIDPRASATTVSALTLRGHTNAVVCLAAEPTNPYGLVSGTHDGTCQIWDIRSVRSGDVANSDVGGSVFSIDRESTREKLAGARVATSKVLAVAWDKDVGIVSGGEDKKVQINRGLEVSSSKSESS